MIRANNMSDFKDTSALRGNVVKRRVRDEDIGKSNCAMPKEIGYESQKQWIFVLRGFNLTICVLYNVRHRVRMTHQFHMLGIHKRIASPPSVFSSHMILIPSSLNSRASARVR